jgi:hypothetical protein
MQLITCEIPQKIKVYIWPIFLGLYWLVPSGGDSGPCRTSTELKFSVINIRVQLREIKCMAVDSKPSNRFKHGKCCLDFIRQCK